MAVQIILLGAGFFLLVKGADYFVEGAAGIADRFGIPQLVIGLTIVAMGTSAPEAAVSMTAALKGSAGITVGNVIGSNTFNTLAILGITACIVPLTVAGTTLRFDLPCMLGATALLLGIGLTGEKITFWESMLLLAGFAIYLACLFRMAIQEREKGYGESLENEGENYGMAKLAAMGGVGLLLIIMGSDISVDAAVKIAGEMGVSERVIGLTIVAVGTSLPELVTSVSAAVKGKADIAIGNIVGSNIFNVLFIVGITACITPVPFLEAFIPDTLIAAASGLLLLICVRKKKLTRAGGALLLTGYIIYFIYLV